MTRGVLLHLLQKKEQPFLTRIFSVSSCVLSPTGWRSSEFRRLASHNPNRTDPMRDLFLSSSQDNRWSIQASFFMKFFFFLVTHITLDSCLFGLSWQCSCKTAKNTRDTTSNRGTELVIVTVEIIGRLGFSRLVDLFVRFNGISW